MLSLDIAQNTDGSYPLFHERGAVGSFLNGLFGYHTSISLTELAAYAIYLGIIYLSYRMINRPVHQQKV